MVGTAVSIMCADCKRACPGHATSIGYCKLTATDLQGPRFYAGSIPTSIEVTMIPFSQPGLDVSLDFGVDDAAADSTTVMILDPIEFNSFPEDIC